ncbi:monocarboxylate transporter 9 [Clonorchis sinensis]|uniref:Monocarboxylate transporter 9 n=1 Tax=Clonorchis sinensis TaxID=79923 RepID=H2KPP0_CLOSI|nr:monocarboxylate transporter 9 [Clonorchis sinensis]
MTKDEAASQLTYSIFSQVYHRIRQARDRFYTWRYFCWVVLFVSAVNVIFIGGKRRAFGIFVAALHSSYNETSMSELNWIGDSYASLGFFLMPFATTAIVRLNRPYRFIMFLAGVTIFTSCMTSASVPDPGYLFLTHTILHGIGSTLVLCGCSLVTGDYFDKTHRFHVLATAFVSGGPYGVLLFGPLFSYWIHDYSWQEAFVFSGILFLFVTWLGAVTFLPRDMQEYSRAELELAEPLADRDAGKKDELRKPKKPSVATNIYLHDQPKASDGRGWAFCSVDHLRNNPQVFLWAFERLLHNVVIYGLLMNLTAYVTQSLNNELIRGAKVNLYFGIGESIIFTIGALIGDRIRGKLPIVYLIGAGFSALFLIIVQRSYTDINVVYVLSGLTGGAVGVGNTFLYATAEEVMLVHGSIAFPMTKMVAGVGMIIAPAFSGSVIDGYGYRGFFISMAILVSLRVVLLALVCIILHHKHKMMLKEVVEKGLLGEQNNLVHCCQYTTQDCEIKRIERERQQQQQQREHEQQHKDQELPKVIPRNGPKSEQWHSDPDQKVP